MNDSFGFRCTKPGSHGIHYIISSTVPYHVSAGFGRADDARHNQVKWRLHKIWTEHGSPGEKWGRVACWCTCHRKNKRPSRPSSTFVVLYKAHTLRCLHLKPEFKRWFIGFPIYFFNNKIMFRKMRREGVVQSSMVYYMTSRHASHSLLTLLANRPRILEILGKAPCRLPSPCPMQGSKAQIA